MATISASIELYDRVSGPIYKIMSAVDNMCTAFESVENSIDSSFDTRAIENARHATQQAAAELAHIGSGINNNTHQQNNFNQSVQHGTASMSGLLTKVMAVGGTIMGLGKIGNISDEFVQTTARVNLMNDGLQTTPELLNLIYQSAQNARGSMIDMAAVVARFGNNAKDAFGSSREVIAFTNLIQKQMTIAGASGEEAANAMLQLSQALGSGVLRGDELNSIFEQAPNLIQSIADYMDVPIGQIRNMASEGQLSADIVKKAIFASADDINAKFAQMPMTWGQVWTTMKNTALMEFQPVLNKINELANNQQFQQFASGVISALATVGVVLLDVMELAGYAGSFIAEHWNMLGPIVMGVTVALGLYAAALLITNTIQGVSAVVSGVKAAASMMEAGATFTATAAQYGFNAALLACPITWIIVGIIMIIALIYGICAGIAHLTGVAATGFGIITGCINVVIQFFWQLLLTAANVGIGIGNAASAAGSNIYTAFSNSISSVQAVFYDLLATAMSVISQIAAALSKLPFVKFDAAGLSAAASGYANKAASARHNKREYKNIGAEFKKGLSTFDTFSSGWAGSAFSAGVSWGDGVMGKLSGGTHSLFDGAKFEMPNIVDAPIPQMAAPIMGGGTGGGTGGGPAATAAGKLPSHVSQIADNTAAIADGIHSTDEELKYLRDLAEREAVNRSTMSTVQVEIGGITNVVKSDADLDGIVDYIVSGVEDALQQVEEGDHA